VQDQTAGIELLSTPGEPFQALATSHFFFKDNDFTPVAHLNKNGILFLPTEAGREASAKRDAYLARISVSIPRVGAEKRFEREIMADLRRRGVLFEHQKKCAYGIIDLFIPGNPPSIIELKEGQDRQSIGEAIGQLAFYSSEYPDAELYIGVPGGLCAAVRGILARWGIREWQA